MKKLLFVLVIVIISSCAKQKEIKTIEIYEAIPIKVDSIDIYLNKSSIEFSKFLYHHRQFYLYVHKDMAMAKKHLDSMNMADKMESYYDKRHALLLIWK